MSDAVKIVDGMIAAWHRLDPDAIAAAFAEDGVWQNIPFPPSVGREEIRKAVAAALAGMTSAEFRIHHQGEVAPGIVMNERSDIFVTRDGKTLTFPVMGVFEIEGGRIRAWRDYFDSALLAAMA